MAITKDVGRQAPLSAQIDFTYLTLETNLVVQTAKILEAFDLPANSVVVGGEIVVTTAFVGPTVATLGVGDGASTTRYASAVDLKTAARTALTLTGFKYAEFDTVDFKVDTTVAVATAGAGYVRISYVTVGRVTENV